VRGAEETNAWRVCHNNQLCSDEIGVRPAPLPPPCPCSRTQPWPCHRPVPSPPRRKSPSGSAGTAAAAASLSVEEPERSGGPQRALGGAQSDAGHCREPLREVSRGAPSQVWPRTPRSGAGVAVGRGREMALAGAVPAAQPPADPGSLPLRPSVCAASPGPGQRPRGTEESDQRGQEPCGRAELGLGCRERLLLRSPGASSNGDSFAGATPRGFFCPGGRWPSPLGASRAGSPSGTAWQPMKGDGFPPRSACGHVAEPSLPGPWPFWVRSPWPRIRLGGLKRT